VYFKKKIEFWTTQVLLPFPCRCDFISNVVVDYIAAAGAAFLPQLNVSE
jgi:hypothetical protein